MRAPGVQEITSLFYQVYLFCFYPSGFTETKKTGWNGNSTDYRLGSD